MQRNFLFRLLAVIFLAAAALKLSAQGTAFSYQGQLIVSGSPANANYDFRFTLYNAASSGTPVSLPLTNSAVPVSNGLFTVTLDFGAGIFTGASVWLDIGVRPNSSTAFSALTPRQPILPVPYAIFATSASNLVGYLQSTQIVGNIASALIAGTYSNAVNFSSAGNTFSGTFSGNGSALTSLNAGNISTGTLADSHLSSNVPLLNGTQTFTGGNTFNGPTTLNGNGTFAGVNTFSNSANYFKGSFFGNGLVGWVAINGTSTTAASDTGYMLQNASLTTVTLPASPSAGDIVRISGAGKGGWLVKENSGQTIIGNFASYPNGVLASLPLTTLPATQDYQGVAASADGSRIYVVGNGLSGSGGGSIGSVYVSSDGGQNWINISTNHLSGTYVSVACSANGKIVYAEPTGTTSAIAKSTDGGVTWTTSGNPLASGVGIACSADGSTLFNTYTSMACSGNGTYLARVTGGTVSYSITGNGASWTGVTSTPWSPSSVTCVGASSDCTRMIVGVNGGYLYATANQGQSWTQLTTSAQAWSSVWMSPDGSKFAATISKNGGINGSIIYCNVQALPNTVTTTSTGSLCGSFGSAAELQYIGSGQFMPVSSTGLLWAN